MRNWNVKLSLVLVSLLTGVCFADGYLEYVQGNGSAFVNVSTNYDASHTAPFTLTKESVVEAVVEPVAANKTCTIWCNRGTKTTTDTDTYTMSWMTGQKFRLDYAPSGTGTEVAATVGERYRLLAIPGGSSILTNLTSGGAAKALTSTDPVKNFTPGNGLVLFRSFNGANWNSGSNNYGNHKLYSFKVWRNKAEYEASAEPVLDLRPYVKGCVVGLRNEVGSFNEFFNGNADGNFVNDTIGTYVWNGGAEGAWEVASNWLLKGANDADPKELALPAQSPTNDCIVKFDSANGTVRFPTAVTETVFDGKVNVCGPAPDSGSDAVELVLDTRGTAFHNVANFGTQPFVCGWSYANSKWSAGANQIFLYKPLQTDTIKFTDGIMRFAMSPTNTTMIQESGAIEVANRPFHLNGHVGNGVTNWAEIVVKSGDFNAGLKMRGASRFRFDSPGSFNTETIRLLPNADNTGDYFGGGRAEFIMSAGTNTSNYGTIDVGEYGGADAYFELCGTARIHRGGTGVGTDPNFRVASGTASNSSPTTPVRGEAVFAGSSSYRVLGRNDATKQYGNIIIAAQSTATAVDAVGKMTVKDDATVQFDRGKIVLARSEGARGYLTVEGRGTLKALGVETAKLAASEVGLTLGGPLSVEAVVTIRDEATLETPRVAATTASTKDGFVRNALLLEGGTLLTQQIEGGALDVVISGGVIRARAASTAEKPLIGGLKSLTVADGVRVVIDTQDYDVYVNQDFGAGVTVEKRGAGTLYVAGSSSHATTLVYEGAVQKLDESFTFGTIYTAPGTATWKAAAPANWSDWTSWDPEGLVGGNTAVSVTNDAQIILHDGDEAKSLSFTGSDTVTFSGNTTMNARSVTVSADAAKAFAVPEGSRVEIVATNYTSTATAFAKTGPGELVYDFSAFAKQTDFATSGGTVAINNGTLTLKGRNAGNTNGKLWSSSSASFGYFYIGGTGSQTGSSATLVLDNMGIGRQDNDGSSRTLYLGHGATAASPATSTLVMVNGATVCQGTVRIGSEPTVPHHARLFMTNAYLRAPAGTTIQFGYASTAAAAENLQVTARLNRSKITATAGGNCNGMLAFGAELDVVLDNGSEIDIGHQTADRTRGFIYANTRCWGNVTIADGSSIEFGGAFMVNNCSTDVSASRKFTLAFDGGRFVPKMPAADGSRENYEESRWAIFRSPEHQGFVARVGGMTVDMSNTPRYTLAAPVRGEGALVKTGSGTLVLGRGRTFAAGNTTYASIKDKWVTNDVSKVVESGVITMQNAGGVHVTEGIVEVEEGATDANSNFTVEEGCGINLAGNAVALGLVCGEGSVSNGTVNAMTIPGCELSSTGVKLSNLNFVRRPVVDLGRTTEAPAGKNDVFLLGKVENCTGLCPCDGMILNAVNSGDSQLGRVRLSSDSNGNIVCSPCAGTGLVIICR